MGGSFSDTFELSVHFFFSCSAEICPVCRRRPAWTLRI